MLRAPLLPGALLLLACTGDPEPAEAPAHVENPVTETALTTVHLSREAVARIGIELGEVQSASVQGRLVLGGELMAVPGRAATITAPRAATVLAPVGARLAQAGDVVRDGQVLLRLAVLPGDVARSGEEVAIAEARHENARLKSERAERLLAAGVGSQAEAEDARAELHTAEALLIAARARLVIQSGGVTADSMSALIVRSPHAGIVQSVSVTAGQAVGDGAALLEVVDADPLWVRVPVYTGDLAKVDRSRPATLQEPGQEGTGRSIDPVNGPTTADPSTASADLFYRVSNANRRYRPGERVAVSLPLRAEATESVVPWSAILYDIHGGTWLYQALGDDVFTRRRVDVRRVTGDLAVLARGPAPGTRIVVVGAAELFSTEFGTSH
jgi:RND family efflux transporter MFP subunit